MVTPETMKMLAQRFNTKVNECGRTLWFLGNDSRGMHISVEVARTTPRLQVLEARIIDPSKALTEQGAVKSVSLINPIVWACESGEIIGRDVKEDVFKVGLDLAAYIEHDKVLIPA